MKKVVILSNPDRGYVVGGAENARLMLAKELAKRNYEVTLFGQVEPDGVEDILNYIQVKGNWARLDGWKNFHKAMRQVNPDVLVCKVLNPILPVYAFICWLTNTKLFYFAEHDWELTPRPDKRIKGWRWRLFWIGIQFTNRLFVQNPVQYKGFKKLLLWGKNRVEITRNIPLMTALETYEPHGDIYTWIGSYRPHKNPDWVPAIAEALPQKKFLLVLDCKGDKTIENRFFADAERLPNFEFIPGVKRNKLPELFSNAAITMITSEGEGYPNVAVEAWSKGRAVMSTPSNALAHMKENEGVILCNTVADFVETIANMTDERLENCNKGALGYYKKNYSSDEIINGITTHI